MIAVFVGAVGGGAGAWWASGGAADEGEPVAETRSGPPPIAASSARKPPESLPVADAAANAPTASVDEGPSGGIRADPRTGDDPELRARLEKQAALAMPYWARIAPRFADPQDRVEAAAMVERLGRLDELSAVVAHDEYRLTQRLITKGGLDRGSQYALDYLNSTSAAVIQGGDPGEVMTPEQATARTPR